MRYLLDTNIFIYLVIDPDQLSRDVKDILDDYDNTFYMSSESVKELIVGFNNGKLVSRFWDTAAKMVKDITNRYFIRILPVGEEHMDTYAHLTLNLAEDHRDPSDHVIIATPSPTVCPWFRATANSSSTKTKAWNWCTTRNRFHHAPQRVK